MFRFRREDQAIDRNFPTSCIYVPLVNDFFDFFVGAFADIVLPTRTGSGRQLFPEFLFCFNYCQNSWLQQAIISSNGHHFLPTVMLINDGRLHLQQYRLVFPSVGIEHHTSNAELDWTSVWNPTSASHPFLLTREEMEDLSTLSLIGSKGRVFLFTWPPPPPFLARVFVQAEVIAPRAGGELVLRSSIYKYKKLLIISLWRGPFLIEPMQFLTVIVEVIVTRIMSLYAASLFVGFTVQSKQMKGAHTWSLPCWNVTKGQYTMYWMDVLSL